VTIDGGKRTIELSQAGSLITVKAGVTLTLRNITIIGAAGNKAPLVYEDGGRVIYETGVSTFNQKPPLSNSKTKGGSGIDLIQEAHDTDANTALTVTLDPGTEVVSLDDTADIGTGLVLNSGNSPAEVTINGNGRTIRLDGNTKGSVITVGTGVTLTLKNITFVGIASNDGELITVKTGGTLVFENDVTISGNTYTFGGGGVGVLGGTFTMNGGTISGNTGRSRGGGVTVLGGTFTMSGGTISNNHGGQGGVSVLGTFTMSGGTISGNTSSDRGGGVYVEDTFTMSGGTISGNTATRYGGGVYVDIYCPFTKTAGTIYGSDGGDLANKAGNGIGHAVSVGDDRKRNSTAGLGTSMDTGTSGAGGGWE
jgi:hypothetical protein